MEDKDQKVSYRERSGMKCEARGWVEGDRVGLAIKRIGVKTLTGLQVQSDFL